MKRVSLVLLIHTIFCSILFFSFPNRVYAGTITLGQSVDHLGSIDEVYTVPVKIIVNVSNGTQYYLRAQFYKSGTSNYCGFTWNGTDWNNNVSDWQKFLPITITNDTWEGELRAKLDQNDTGCKDSGTYTFKIQRYTSAGSASSDTINEQTITVTLPTLTPTPTAIPFTPTPTATPKPTSTPKPTATTTPVPTPTVVPTTKQVTYPTTKQHLGKLTTTTIYPTAVLGASTASTDEKITVTPIPKPTESIPKNESPQTPMQTIFLIGMLVLATITAAYGFYIYKQSTNKL